MNGFFASANNGQSGTGTRPADSALLEDIKQRIADNITKVILQQYGAGLGILQPSLSSAPLPNVAAATLGTEPSAPQVWDSAPPQTEFTIPPFTQAQGIESEEELVSIDDFERATAVVEEPAVIEHQEVPKTQRQLLENGRKCNTCERMLRLEAYNRDGAISWLTCNRCTSWSKALSLTPPSTPVHESPRSLFGLDRLGLQSTHATPEPWTKESLEFIRITPTPELEQELQGDQQTVVRQDEQQREIESRCRRCNYIFPLSAFIRKAQSWKTCNECAAKERVQRDKRNSLKKIQNESSIVSQHVPFFQPRPLPGNSPGFHERSLPFKQATYEHCTGDNLESRQTSFILPEVDVKNQARTGLQAERYWAGRECSTCNLRLPPDAFTRQGRTSWVTCNVCRVNQKQKRAAKKAHLKARLHNFQVWNVADESIAVFPSIEVHNSSGGTFNVDFQSEQGTSSEDRTEEQSASQETTPEPEPKSCSIPKEISARFLACDWRSANILNYTAPRTSFTAFHRHLIDYALSIRLLEIAARWHPSRTQPKAAREDFSREVYALLRLLQEGRIQPWPPLTAWMHWCIREKEKIRFDAARLDAKGSLQHFSESRQLTDKLTSIATALLEHAKVEIEVLFLELEPEGECWEDDLETLLSDIKRQVVDECRDSGCLGLGDIFSPQDIKDAHFSKYWVLDNLSSE